MRIVVTGANGFIGSNLVVRLGEVGGHDVRRITRESSRSELGVALSGAEVVFHLAGVNRPQDPAQFGVDNADFTGTVCGLLKDAGKKATIVLASSTQAGLDNPYGQSKRAAEDEVRRYAKATGARAFVYRLPNVFGKWCRPNYNSAVATFCHNTARGLPIIVHDPSKELKLVYVDDVLIDMIGRLNGQSSAGDPEVAPVYVTTVGEVADAIRGIASGPKSLAIPRVGTGLLRALYATYVSYLPPASFAYPLTQHVDARGAFAEVLKTADSGQMSFFTAKPGITRGGHYHHTKTEKFVVVRGKALFRFRHLLTNELIELQTDSDTPRVVETVPGWAHDITNVGSDEMIVMLWANEVFDPSKPDTISAEVAQ